LLESVSDYVDVRENAAFDAPKLKQCGHVDVRENATFDAPLLESVSDYVDVRENATFDAPLLESISGHVDVRENATFDAPKLKQCGHMYVSANATFDAPKLKQCGYVDVRENATFDAPLLESVGGYVDVRENATLEKRLWKIASKNKWYITEHSSQWIIDKNGDNFEYRLHDVILEREWFLKIKNDKLIAEEVFAIDNIEHRRVAYEFMSKNKLTALKDFKELDSKVDDYKNRMRVLSFTIQNMEEPIKLLNVICPSTGREYFIGTDCNDCSSAKAKSFGLDNKNIEWLGEW